MTIALLHSRLVDFIPKELEDGVLYISIGSKPQAIGALVAAAQR